MIIRDIRSGDGVWDDLTMKMLESGMLVSDIRENGYAVKGRNRFTETPGKTSSIARPVFGPNGVVGSIVLIFFSSAMKIDAAVAKYGEDLKQAAERISEDLIAAESPMTRAYAPTDEIRLGA